MKTIEKNSELVAFCGLYCGACSKYVNEKCSGCAENEKASWCKIRSCCIDAKIKSCAECGKNGVENCKDYNNLIGKTIEFFSKTSRGKCIDLINTAGYDKFAQYMTENKIMSLKK